LILAN